MLGLAAALGVLLCLPVDALGATERVNYRAESPDGPRTFFDHGGLILRGSCQEMQGDLHVDVETKFNNAVISLNGQDGDGSAVYAERTDFDIGDDLVLFDEFADDGDSSTGQIVYARPGGKVVTVDWAGEEAEDFIHGNRDCGFFGAARVVESGSADRINFRAEGGGSPTPILSRAGMTLTARCDDGHQLFVDATSAVDDAMIHHNAQSDDPSDNSAFADHEDEFDGSDEVTIPVTDGDSDSSNGHFIYARPDGKVLTVDWTAHEDESMFGNDTDCAFVGTARVRDPGDPKLLDYASDSEGVSFFNTGGLELKASCIDEDLITRVRSRAHGSIIHVNSQSPFTPPLYGEDDFAENAEVDEHPLFGIAANPYFFDWEPDASSGQLISAAPNGTYVTIDWLTEEDGQPFDGQFDCAFLGTAEVVSPG